MRDAIKAYVDLTRLHFFFVWPTLLCAGLFLAFQFYDGFSWLLVAKVALIGFFGFEAGLVLNDIVDWKLDKKEVEFDKLTKYWRVFGKRPISQGLISQRRALLLFALFVGVATTLILTLPFPQSMYLFGIMVVCYCLEVFYQIKKRNENFPIAQLAGRIDFTLFPVAGYLCLASPDFKALLFAFFFYPLAQAHLGVNDIADVANDRAKDLKTIPVLYGMRGTTYWILLFSAIHIVAAIFFFNILSTVTIVGFVLGFVLVSIGNYRILKGKSADAGIKALPMFHVAMLIYAISLILGYVI
jgi:4-hydroxybenzoate polyprenyltransferase